MKPIKFKAMNSVLGKKQLQYLDLPAFIGSDGIVTTCWKVTFVEKITLLFTGKLYIQVMAFGNPIQPQKPCARYPLKNLQ